MIFKKYTPLLLLLIFVVAGAVLALFKTPKPIQIPKENTKNTAAWKEYKNSEYKFSFKYPEGLLSNFVVNTTGLGSETLKNLSTQKESSTKNATNTYNVVFEANGTKFDGTADEFLNEKLPEIKGLKKEPIRLGDLEGVRISNNDQKTNAHFLYNIFWKGSFVYNFALYSDDPILITGNKQLLTDILSTAKFE